MTVHQDRIRRATLFVALAALLVPAAAAAQSSREDLATAARAFDESALRQKDNNALPMPVRKWTTPIRLVFDNPSAMPSLVEPTRQAIKYEAGEAGLKVIDIADRADPSANYKVLFDENGLTGDAGSCFGSFWWQNWQINRAELRINPIRIRDIDRCIYHEPMHTLGFGSHPHAALSVLSYVYKAQRTLTPLDLHLIHTLYDSRLAPGLKSQPASQLACRILGERLGSTAADIEAVCRDRAGPTPAIN